LSSCSSVPVFKKALLFVTLCIILYCYFKDIFRIAFFRESKRRKRKDEATKTFQLTPKVLRLGAGVVESMGIKQRLLPFTPKTITEKDSFLSELQKTRERGYAMADQELTIGLKIMAIPIFNTKGCVEASFGVSYPLSRAQKQGFENSLIDRLIDVRNKA